jgi:hypothetical protein
VGKPDLGELQVDTGDAGEPHEEDADGKLCQKRLASGSGVRSQ